MGVALGFTVLSNGYWVGFLQGTIYQGPLKMGCVPGLNCYACPGALGSCPIGAMQNCLAGTNRRPSFVVLGFLLVFGSLLGRVVCGWLCPIGLLQDALQYIRSKKKRSLSLPGHSKLKYFKYIILTIFVFLLPLLITKHGTGSPWFCKYICPSGTILGGFPLLAKNAHLRQIAGVLFGWKTLLAAILIIGSVLIYRPFCKYICPLGAIYGFFNRLAVIRLHVSLERCIDCGQCIKVCPMEVDVIRNPNSAECIRCGRCVSVCPTKAIYLGTDSGASRTIGCAGFSCSQQSTCSVSNSSNCGEK
ncbi:MAG TPA: 4Fe-4S binding protein [Clostridiaceae bacterium]|nr:4Fe-4S binding protein [Clostridiaceae bacterium]